MPRETNIGMLLKTTSNNVKNVTRRIGESLANRKVEMYVRISNGVILIVNGN
jgi:hypothetical protein